MHLVRPRVLGGPGEFVPECSCAGGMSGPCGMNLFHPLGLAMTGPPRTYAPVRGRPRAGSGGPGRSTPGHASAVEQFQRPGPHPNARDVPDRAARGGEHRPDGPGCPESSLIWLRSRRAAAPVSSSTCTTTRPPWMRTPWPKRSSDTPRRAGSRPWPPRTGQAHPSLPRSPPPATPFPQLTPPTRTTRGRRSSPSNTTINVGVRIQREPTPTTPSVSHLQVDLSEQGRIGLDLTFAVRRQPISPGTIREPGGHGTGTLNLVTSDLRPVMNRCRQPRSSVGVTWGPRRAGRGSRGVAWPGRCGQAAVLVSIAW